MAAGRSGFQPGPDPTPGIAGVAADNPGADSRADSARASAADEDLNDVRQRLGRMVVEQTEGGLT
jgi:hypothetical protein